MPVPDVMPRIAGDTATAAANTAVVITYAAQTYVRHAITQIKGSYNATATAPTIKVEDGAGNTVFQQDLAVAAGPFALDFTPALAGSINTALIVTLGAGGAAVVGKLNVSRFGEVS